MAMNSQNDEEAHILHYFGDASARFYDIGAWNGVQMSNTYALLERGWSGVLVEPEFNAFAALQRNLKPYASRIELVNAAVSMDEKLMRFWSSRGDAVSTMDEESLRKWDAAVGGMDPYWIRPIAPEVLFRQFGEAEFISLDVEGENWSVFHEIPFGVWEALRMVCVEHDGRHEEMAAHAKIFGFRRLALNPENLLLVR